MHFASAVPWLIKGFEVQGNVKLERQHHSAGAEPARRKQSLSQKSDADTGTEQDAAPPQSTQVKVSA